MDYSKVFERIVEENIRHRTGIDNLMQWVRGSGFYLAPASSKHHLNVPGGLCRHSIHVYERLKSMPNDEEYSDDTLAIVGLFHDVCKVNYYKEDFRDKKEDGRWIKVLNYVIDDKLPLGHGEKSLYIINRFLLLSDEEACAIRWHMGAYGLTDYRDLNNAMKMYPLVVKLQMADMAATYLDEREDAR